MSLLSQAWGTLHPLAFRHAAEPVRRVQATLRPSGAIRYCCPDTGSFELITTRRRSPDFPSGTAACAAPTAVKCI
jgi:hypothetical protein